MLASPAVGLGRWIQVNYPYRDGLTHLKLQKLLFYSYGALLAFDLETPIGEVRFEPWEHGPVNRETWRLNHQFGKSPLPRPVGPAPSFAANVASVLRDVLTVYGSLTSWELREQSHLEPPWRDAYARKAVRIDPGAMRQHFRGKFAEREVRVPELVLDRGSLTLDSIPTQRYPSLNALAAALGAVFAAAGVLAGAAAAPAPRPSRRRA